MISLYCGVGSNGSGPYICVPSLHHTASTMESQASMGTSTAKATRYDTDFTICIICQKQTEELLVEKPTAHWKVLEFTRDRAKYGDGHLALS